MPINANGTTRSAAWRSALRTKTIARVGNCAASATSALPTLLVTRKSEYAMVNDMK